MQARDLKQYLKQGTHSEHSKSVNNYHKLVVKFKWGNVGEVSSPVLTYIKNYLWEYFSIILTCEAASSTLELILSCYSFPG